MSRLVMTAAALAILAVSPAHAQSAQGGNVTPASPNTWNASQVFSATMTFSGVLLCKNFENVKCVDSANSQGWAGADLAGWLQSAANAAPGGGTVLVDPGSSGTVSTSTAIGINNPTTIQLLRPVIWSTSATWTINSPNVSIFGFSNPGVVQQANSLDLKWTGSSGGGPILFAHNQANIRIENVFWDCNSLANIGFEDLIDDQLYVEGPILRNITISGYLTHGIVLGKDDLVTLGSGQFQKALIDNIYILGAGGTVATTGTVGLLHNAQNDEGITIRNVSAGTSGITQSPQYWIANRSGVMDIWRMQDSAIQPGGYSIYNGDTTNVYGWDAESDRLYLTIASPTSRGSTITQVQHRGGGNVSAGVNNPTQTGTAGSAVYCYLAVWHFTGFASAVNSAPACTNTGNATLNGTNFNVVTWNPPPQMGLTLASEDIYRFFSGGTPSSVGAIATGLSPATTSLNDTGLAGDGSTPDYPVIFWKMSSCGPGFQCLNSGGPYAQAALIVDNATLMGDLTMLPTGAVSAVFRAITFLPGYGQIVPQGPNNQFYIHEDPENARIVINGKVSAGSGANLVFRDDTSQNTTTLQPLGMHGGVWSIPDATDTFAGLATTQTLGNKSLTTFGSATNCQLGGASGTTSPAACASAAAGMIAIPSSQTSYTVNTSAVTANSEILLQQVTDNSGLPSSPTCNGTAANPIQSARVAGTSFTFTLTSVPAVTCYKYWVVN